MGRHSLDERGVEEGFAGALQNKIDWSWFAA